jgi:hypothetical protein
VAPRRLDDFFNSRTVVRDVTLNGVTVALENFFATFTGLALDLSEAASVHHYAPWFEHFPLLPAFVFVKANVQRITCIVLRIPTSGQQKARREPG